MSSEAICVQIGAADVAAARSPITQTKTSVVWDGSLKISTSSDWIGVMELDAFSKEFVIVQKATRVSSKKGIRSRVPGTHRSHGSLGMPFAAGCAVTAPTRARAIRYRHGLPRTPRAPATFGTGVPIRTIASLLTRSRNTAA